MADLAPVPDRSERWTFLTNHGHALICITRDPDIRIRELAHAIGVTERTAQVVVNDLVDGGYVERRRVGTRSHYKVHPDLPLRHPVERHHDVRDLLVVLSADGHEEQSR
jgi:DNA-binding transcriptional ArsR family regulator